jgi:hypothetical protein
MRCSAFFNLRGILQKTGSRLAGRDDTVFGAGVVCFGAGWLILYGALASAATLNLRRNLLRHQDFFQSIGAECILGKEKAGTLYPGNYTMDYLQIN